MKNIIIVCGLLVGCGGHGVGDIDKTIGAECSTDRDCDHRCFMGGSFPGGFCSNSCVDDLDCPDDSFCMTENGGVCMYECPVFDCSRLGGDWSCRERDRQNGGKANVCSG